MIHRIVKMTFKVEHIEAFQEIFSLSKDRIASFPGCKGVKLLQDQKDPRQFFTFSYWTDEKALEAYRKSVLFKNTWKATKALFDDRPMAWSTNLSAEGQKSA
jgi:heme-degrading monooxygenase HmoA